MNIILLDKESDRITLVVSALASAGHACRPIAHPDDLAVTLSRERCDMLIIDWQATLGRGMEMVKSIRSEQPPELPILLLTARGYEDDITTALETGADDYLLKPLRRPELLFRISVSLKRAYPESSRREQLEFGPYSFEAVSGRLALDGQTIEVTHKEFALALLLFRNLGRPLSRAYIMEAVWPDDAGLSSRTLDTHISRVRSKLRLRPEQGFRLAPVYSYGYQLEQLPR